MVMLMLMVNAKCNGDAQVVAAAADNDAAADDVDDPRSPHAHFFQACNGAASD
jgi:hypothetical protein